jgi:probable F420-dependent oxidoreductase
MQYGALFPGSEIGSDPILIRDWVQAAEQIGYESITIPDHVVGHDDSGLSRPPLNGAFKHPDEFHESLTLASYIAACTSRILIKIGVLILPQRQTMLVAKQSAELAILSGDRFILGVGIGWNYVEYETLCVPFERRGRRFEEQIEVLRKVWTEDMLDYTGEFHRIDRAAIRPLPRKPIPVWFGTSGAEKAMRRAAQLGDGFMTSAVGDAIFSQMERMIELLEAQGRSIRDFPVEAQIDLQAGPEEWNRIIDRWESLHGHNITLRALGKAAAGFVGQQPLVFDDRDSLIKTLSTFWDGVPH